MTSNTTMPDLSNPFPGLRCFLSEEDYLFFGRHEQIEDLLRRLRTNRLVAVVGTSGSGKSSLVRAGLLPAVLGGGMAQAGSAWEIAVMRPGGSPLAQLARALCEAGLYDADAEDALFHLQATLNRSRNGLVEAVRQSQRSEVRGQKSGSKLLLVVDQFEELFRFHRASATSQEEAIGFVNLLLHATQQVDQSVYVVLTMRSDFLGECSQFLGLAEAVNDGEFLIPRMTRDQIQEAIVGPIRVRGAAIAPRLLFRLLNDVQDSQDQLPVLQHALMRTWALATRHAHSPLVLDLEHYEATGGMQEALSQHADEVFAALPSDPHRTAAARIFKALTERGPDGRGIRRPTRLGQLTAIAGERMKDEGGRMNNNTSDSSFRLHPSSLIIVREIIEAYRVPGVTFLMPPVTLALDDNTVIDISHESLMRVWRRLRGWVEEEAQSARIYRRLHETAVLHGEKRAGLYHDPDLQIARSWREVSGPNAVWAEQYGGGFAEAMAFLEESRAAAERAEQERESARQRELERARHLAEAQARVARLFKRFVGGLAVGVCLTVALTIWAFTVWAEATRQAQAAKRLENAAEKERQRAEENQKKAKALGLVQRLVNVPTSKVPAIISEIAENRHWSDRFLRKEFEKAAEKSAKKLHASLALLPVDSGQVDYLYGRLLEADAQELPVVRDALAPHRDRLVNKLWAVVENRKDGVLNRLFAGAEKPKKGKESQRLRAAAALATFDPDNERWANAQGIADDLVAVPAAQLAAWKDAFRPVRLKLLAALSLVYRSMNLPAERSLATELLADYAADQPQVLADLVLDADEKQFAIIFPKLKTHRGDSVAVLRAELDRRPVLVKEQIVFETDGTIGQREAKVKRSVVKGMPAIRFDLPLRAGKAYRLTMESKELDSYLVLQDKAGRELAFDDDSGGYPNALIIYSPTRDDTYSVFAASLGGGTGSFHFKIVDTADDGATEKLVKRQVNAAVALLQMDQPSKVWPLLKHSPDPRVRSYLIHALGMLGADAKTIVKELNRQSDMTIRRALLLSLGEFSEKDFTPDERQALLPKLQEMYRTASDPGFHAALEWLLQRWKEGAWLKDANQAWAAQKQQHLARLQAIQRELTTETGKDEARWYLNGQGQTLVVIPGPVEFWMGSPLSEEGRAREASLAGGQVVRPIGPSPPPAGGFVAVPAVARGNLVSRPEGTIELRHWRRIRRSFAIASKEVTVQQFLRFRPEHPVSRQHAPSDDCPVNAVTWYEAAAYCNWLSEQEGIPADQWCYEPNAEGKYDQGMKMAADYLQRTGYRLPTEAEWEYACRAGAATRYSFGASEELLPKYAWYLKNSNNRSWPVGSLKPNDFGLFDMHGNAWEWCQDAFRPYGKAEDGKATEDPEDLADTISSNRRLLRGGSLWHPAPVERSASRGEDANPRNSVIGFRPARTMPFSSFNRYGAACASALAAAGQGKDKPPKDDAAKAKLRRQALDWLKAELTNWGKVQPPRAFIARNLWHWQQDRALAGIRDQAALAKLPPDEQKSFTNLWAEVANAAEPANGTERLEFAHVAALIAAGQGKDEPPLSDGAKAKLRAQASDWLKAELTAGTDRSSKAQIIASAMPLPGLLEKLAESAPNDGRFQAELARHYAERGENALANAARTKARALFEAQLARQPENAVLAGALAADLADLLLSDSGAKWAIIKPTRMKSEGGATLSLLDDGSILAGGNNPDRDVYSVVAKSDLKQITAIRLEALPDPSLPSNGPGRFPGTGNFHLSKLRVFSGGTAVPVTKIIVVHSETPNFQNVVDGKTDSTIGWSNYPRAGMTNSAVVATWLQRAKDDDLKIDLHFSRGFYTQHNLGRFRLSVSGDPATFDLEEKRRAVLKLTDPWLKLAAVYALIGSKDEALHYFGKALPRAVNRAGKARIIAMAAPLPGLLEKLAESTPKDGLFHAELARHFADRGNYSLANAASAKACAWFEAELAKEPDDTEMAAELAEVLLIHSRAKASAGSRALPERFVRLGRQNEANGIDLVDYKTDGATEPTEIEGQQCRLVETVLRGWGHAYFVIENGFKWAPTMNVQMEIDYWADSPGNFRIQYDSHDNSYKETPALVQFDGSSGWKTARFALKGARFANSQNGRADFRVMVRTAGRFCLKRLSVRRPFPGEDADDAWLKLAAAYAVNGRNDEALPYFSKELQQAGAYEGRKAIIEIASHFHEVLSALAQGQPDDPPLQLTLARKLVERGKQRLAEKQTAKAQAEFDKSRAIYTRLLAKYPEPRWTVLTPTETKSEGGATLTKLNDNSILAGGNNPDKDTYTFVAQTDLPRITGFRLEAMAHESLPVGGPGRVEWGNFALSEISLKAGPLSGAGEAASLEITNPLADFEQSNQPVAASLDGNSGTAWAILPQVRKNHTAVFDIESSQQTGFAGGTKLTFTLDFQSNNKHAMGRFRLSITNDATTLQATRLRMDLKDSEVVDLLVALAKAHGQQGHVNEAVASFTEAIELSADRAARARVVTEAATLDGVLEKLAERAAGNAQFQGELARHYYEQGRAPLAAAAGAKARALFERKLAERPDNLDLAHSLADLLLIDTARWNVLKPTKMSSPGGETFAVETDGSILVSGPTSERAVYNLKLRTDLPTLTALRLETIPDARLPHGGAGRSAGNGNFHLAEFTATIESGNASGKPTPIVISRAIADYPEGENQKSTNFIDGNPRTLWDTYPAMEEAHWALLGLKSAARMDGGGLSITLDSGISQWGPHGLGRFRLSASDDPAAFERQQKRVALLKLSDPWAKLAAAYHAIGDQAARDKLLERHPAATAGIGNLYALQQDWKRALAEYTKAIAQGTKDARTFAARAEVYEKLEQWELAATDWGNADFYASDKKVRFGSPSFPALERRAQIHGRLQQWAKQVQDFTGLLKPERLGDHPWMFNGRGEAYDHLRQWDKALADFDQAVKFAQPNEREAFQFLRARHFAVQGQWRQAADDLRPIFQKPANKEWWRLRDAALIFAIVGDEANCRQTAAECYSQHFANISPDDGRWTVLALVQYPEMITKDNRAQVLELARKTDAYWQPRLTAAIHFRSGAYQKAAEFFDANGPGPQFLFLAAMTYQKLGKHDRARQLLEEGNSWIREQRGKDPGAGVPKQYYSWQDWVIEAALQTEASEMILGPAPDAPRKLALQGQLAAAAKAYARLLADAPDPKTKSRIMDELAQFDDVLTAVHVLHNDWKNAAAAFSKQIELNLKAESWQWMKAPTLWAYAGETGRHRESCQKMYARYRNSTIPNDTERCLKMMLIVEPGPELPGDAVKKFYLSIDKTPRQDRAWFLAARALLECRTGQYAVAHKGIDEALAAEKKAVAVDKELPNVYVKAFAMAVRSLIYAKQKDVGKARTSLDQLKQVMSGDLKMKWQPNGRLDGSTILKGVTVEHDKLIPEILRREAERVIQAAVGSANPKTPAQVNRRSSRRTLQAWHVCKTPADVAKIVSSRRQTFGASSPRPATDGVGRDDRFVGENCRPLLLSRKLDRTGGRRVAAPETHP
jgi:formylglycine-generating enzyme required for sulfatase activity/tetratricopeptide (TPR) repeat protein